MATESKDQSVLNHIDRLVKEEEQLYGQSELADEDRERLAGLKVELDQCWDLLRQRRALREFGRIRTKRRSARHGLLRTTNSRHGVELMSRARVPARAILTRIALKSDTLCAACHTFPNAGREEVSAGR